MAGVNTAVCPLYVTVPATAVLPCLSVNVSDVSVAGSITLSKAAATVALIGTSVAAEGGLVAVMKGACTGSTSAPRMAARPLSPPPQPAAISDTKTAADHGRYFEKRGMSCIIFPGESDVDCPKKSMPKEPWTQCGCQVG